MFSFDEDEDEDEDDDEDEESHPFLSAFRFAAHLHALPSG
jgi:hypothetical protein